MNDQLISSGENQGLTLTGYTKQIVWGWVLWVAVERFKFQIKFQSSQLVYGRKAANHMAAFACSEGVSKMALSWELAGSFSTDTFREPMSLVSITSSDCNKNRVPGSGLIPQRDLTNPLKFKIFVAYWIKNMCIHAHTYSYLHIYSCMPYMYMHTYIHICLYKHTCLHTHAYVYFLTVYPVFR